MPLEDLDDDDLIRLDKGDLEGMSDAGLLVLDDEIGRDRNPSDPLLGAPKAETEFQPSSAAEHALSFAGKPYAESFQKGAERRLSDIPKVPGAAFGALKSGAATVGSGLGGAMSAGVLPKAAAGSSGKPSAARVIAESMGNPLLAAVRAADEYGKENLGPLVSEFWERKQKEWAPPPEFSEDLAKNPALITEPLWWAYNAPTIVPTMLPFMVPGAAGGVAGYRLAQAARFSPRAASWAASFGSNAASTASNAIFEGGMAYNAAVESGASPDEASEIAAKVSRRNALWTGLTNISGLAFSPVMKGLSAKIIFESVIEGIQELGEGFLSALTLHQAGRGPEAKLSASEFVLGAVGGGVMGPAFESISSQERNLTTEKAKADLKAEVARQLEEAGLKNAVPVADAAVEQAIKSVGDPATEPIPIISAAEIEGIKPRELTIQFPRPERQATGDERPPISPEEMTALGLSEGPRVSSEEIAAFEDRAKRIRAEEEAQIDVPGPISGKKAYEMPSADFLYEINQASPEPVSAAEAIAVHRDIVEAAEESGKEVPAEALGDTEPEGEADTSFEFKEEPEKSISGKSIHELTPDEFASRFPGAPIDFHKKAVIETALSGGEVPPANLDAYPEIEEEARALDEQRMKVERSRAIKSGEYSPQPALDFARKFGINRESAEKFGHIGELENVLGRGVFRRKGGMTVEQLAEAMSQEKDPQTGRPLIAQNDTGLMFAALDDDARKGKKSELVRELSPDGEYNPRKPETPQGGGPAGAESAGSASSKSQEPGRTEPSDPSLTSEKNQGSRRIPPASEKRPSLFRRSYPYTDSIAGKPFVVKSEADEFLFQEAIENGGDPSDAAFKASRIKYYHDKGWEALNGFAAEKKAGRDGLVEQADFKEAIFRHVLLKYGEVGPNETPDWVTEARAARGGGSDIADRVSPGEAKIAFDFQGKTVSQYVVDIANSIEKVVRKSFPNYIASLKASEELKATGRTSYVGKSVKGPADAAELFSIWMDPFLEHFQVILVKNGKAVDHPTITSGVVDLALIPMEFKEMVKRLIAKTGADSYYFAHNHPSGDPSPSPDDIESTRAMVKQIGPGFKGHVVTDGKQFTLIDQNGRHDRHDFKKPKPDYRPDKTKIDSPEHAMLILSEELADGRKSGIILLDARLQLLGFEHLPPGADIAARAKDALLHFNASNIIIAGDENTIDAISRIVLPRETVDVIWIEGDKVRSMVDSSMVTRSRNRARKLTEEGVTRVAEGEAEYRTPMNPSTFADVMKRRKLGPGSEVTVKTAIDTGGRGRIPRGRKGNIIAIDTKGTNLLVNFNGDAVLTHPDDLVETHVGIPKPKKIPTKKQIEQSTGLGKGPEKTLTENQLLRIKLENQERGSIVGARQARREERGYLLNKFRAEFAFQKASAKAKVESLEYMNKVMTEGMAQARREISDYVTKTLPTNLRGKFLKMVRDAKNPRHVIKAMLRADQLASTVYRGQLVRDIKKVFYRALDSQSVNVDEKDRIRAMMADIELRGRSAETIKKLEETRDFIRKAEAEGRDVEMPAAILDEIQALSRKGIKELSEAELEGVLSNLIALEVIGRKKVLIRKRIWDYKKERLRDELAAGTKPINRHPEVFRKPGERLGWRGRLTNLIAKTMDVFQHVDLAILPMDVIMDILDGSPGYSGVNFRLKETLDAANWRFLNSYRDWVTPIRELAEKLKLDDLNMERIGVHAIRVQNGGEDYLLQNGMEPDEIRAVKLTPEEEQMYRALREAIERPYPSVKELLKKIHNQEIGKEPNYFPFQTDFQATSEAEVYKRLGDSYDGMGRFTRSTEAGFAQKRVGGRQKIKVNAMDVFEHHMADVAYFLAMEENIKLAGQSINTPEYAEAAGEIGQKMMLQWITLLAKRGGGRYEHTKLSNTLDVLRRNLGAANMAFKLSSILVQPTSLFDGAAWIGMHNVMRGARAMMFDKKISEFIFVNVAELRNRVLDDPAFSDLSPNKALEKWQKLGFYGMETVDGYAASWVTAGAYLKYLDEHGLTLDLKEPNAEAVKYASLMLRRSQASPMFKDQALAMSGHLTGSRSVSKALLQFKSFLLNRWATIRHDIPAMARQDKERAVSAIAWLVMANAAELGIRSGTKAMWAALLAGAGLTFKEVFDDDDDDMTRDLAMQALSNIPFATDLARMAVYRQGPIPVFSPIYNAPVGAWSASKAAWQGRNRDALRAMAKTLESFGAMAGIPGTSQAGQITRMILADNTIRFPFADEWRDLRRNAKSGTLRDHERSRLYRLDYAHKQFLASNKRFKSAIERDDRQAAAKIAKDMLKDMEAYRD